MQAAVAQRLIALNKEFYQTHAANFSATRGRLQPGVLRALTKLLGTGQGESSIPGQVLGSALARVKVLDLGCGNGGVAIELARRGLHGEYVGVDFSQGLLEEAEQRVERLEVEDLKFKFLQADLTSGDWAEQPALAGLEIDFILAFAVMHHIPSVRLRLKFLRQVKNLLARKAGPRPAGQFAHSNWQFMRSPKLAARVQAWPAAGLDAADVDPGDYLLDWRSGGSGLRYVHQFNEAELSELAGAAGFRVQEVFYSDGKPGDLSLYSIWETTGKP